MSGTPITGNWVVLLNKLSYAGFQKHKIYQELDSEFGEGNWLVAHFYDRNVIQTEEAYCIYEEAYYQFLKSNPGIREWIVSTASEVYDIEPSNVASGLNYLSQECAATHLQDIAVRRALTRLKLEEQGNEYNPRKLPAIPVFEGDHLVQIRGHTTEGYRLNPGKVPFHRPELILDTEQKGWWDRGSVEDFYQRNKVLIVNPENFIVKLAVLGPVTLFFEHTRRDYYAAEHLSEELTNMLRRIKGRDVRRLYGRKCEGTFIEVRNSPALPYSEWQRVVPHLEFPCKGAEGGVEFTDLSSDS